MPVLADLDARQADRRCDNLEPEIVGQDGRDRLGQGGYRVGVLGQHRGRDEDRDTAFKAAFPQATFWCGILLQLTGCVLLIVDWRPDIGALCLIVFTVLATLLLRFWDVQDPMKRAGMFNGFMSNIAVLGGLLLLLHKRPLTIVPPIQTRAARQAGKRPCR
jgi:hypothetical protein